ncbi:hypothetical protein TVAG_205990 [Trichomonas vaginalis G3]|uniref:Uncharacterized protein n=1 Tax=Trichomonas vaginalis (strain ATCC PRA-98 / G3) TaxID=412133 RepID=A2E1I4_TRIV3|nr:hypothetical protein TVAGG3_0519760 [Trichomonas vaginalis G3]EAY13431.1 hypothetical protein TVAG_205990 [Trichomonas vaginalis G3]KAI5518385.1 hypothetical protein TVAGG3_0519760 [Trichomonas vaginalis G3]|eukprot:XP_001325654.1 hypothetical protein [Trichomonas vaginalis G3]
MFLVFLFTILADSRRLESLVQKYKEQVAKDRTIDKEEEAILWALAEFGQQLDKTVTGEEVSTEIGDRLNQILERVDITDALLRKDFNEMKFEFNQAKEQIRNLVESSKFQIMDEMEAFRDKLTIALQQLVDANKEVQNRSGSKVSITAKHVVQKLRNKAIRRSLIFFVAFQVLLACGVIFYKKLERQLRMLL